MKRGFFSIVTLALVAGCNDQPTTGVPQARAAAAVAPFRASRLASPLTAQYDTGWVEWAYATSLTPFDSISAVWTVPAIPTGSYGDSTSHVIYSTFPALENLKAGTASAILQPVLKYTAEYTDIGEWVLVIEAIQNATALVYDVSPFESYTGDTIYGSVTDTLCNTGHFKCTWRINARDATRGFARGDTLVDTVGQGPFRKAVGGAVEVFNISKCSQYPFSGVFYHGVYASAGGQRFTPTWTDTVSDKLKNYCSFNVTSHLDTVSLYHNYPPPAPLSVTIHGPSRIRPNTPCYYYAVPSGGARPITYEWNPMYQEQDSSVIIVLSWDAILRVTARDSLDQVAQASMLIDTSSSAKACPSAPVR
jgi:hypothetical protein